MNNLETTETKFARQPTRERPITWGTLISRLAPPISGDLYPASPVIAFAQPWLDSKTCEQAAAFWVIFHSITDDGMRLIHASPLPSRDLQVRVALPSGERLCIVVKTVATVKRVDLYETSVHFLAGQVAPSDRRR